LATITSRAHLEASIAKAYRENKYRLSLTSTAYTILLQFLEQKETEGGDDVVSLIQAHLNIITIDRSAAGRERSLAAMMSRRGEEYDYPAEDEGIPGHNPGSANTGPKAPQVLAKLALGPTLMDPDMMEDVQAGLAEEDARNPPDGFEKSLLDVFNHKIKKEPSDDSPSRDAVPLPPPLARDVSMEIQKVREHRDRFKIDPRTGGVAPGISVCMYTFHNTHDR
jgi:transcription initiation factor TFIID subunit 5